VKNEERACNIGLCAERRAPGSAQCVKHRDAYRKSNEDLDVATRGTSKERGYGGPRWERAKKTQRKYWPFCENLTEPGCKQVPRVAEIADHWPRARKQLIADGVRDPDAPEYLRSLCRGCDQRERSRRGFHVVDGEKLERNDPLEAREQLHELRRSRDQRAELNEK
jgi:5-methylcytosine-specific restriction enzyme A